MKNTTFKRALVVLLNQWECGIVGGAYLEIDSVIYGCPDASMEWHKRIRSFMLEEVGMSVSVFHPCLFVHWVDPISLILIGIATDNIEFFFTDTSGAITKVEGIVRQLEGKWPMTFEEEAKDILGMSFDRQSDGSEQVTQPGTMKAVERFFFPSGYAPKTIIPRLPSYEKAEGADLLAAPLKPYQCGLGVLVYLRCTRNDMNDAVRAGRAGIRPSSDRSAGIELPRGLRCHNP